MVCGRAIHSDDLVDVRERTTIRSHPRRKERKGQTKSLVILSSKHERPPEPGACPLNEHLTCPHHQTELSQVNNGNLNLARRQGLGTIIIIIITVAEGERRAHSGLA